MRVCLDLYASIHLVKNVNANDIAGEIELLSYLHSVQCSRRLASVIDEIMGDKVAIGDIVIMKNLDTGEIEKFILAENRADYEDKVASDTTIMMAEAPFGKAVLNNKIQDIVAVTDLEGIETAYKILDIEKEMTYENKVILEIVEDGGPETLEHYQYTLNSDFEMASAEENGLQADFSGRQAETRLKQTGYSIRDRNGRKRTREERWYILITSSIPKLGIDEVMSTIEFHIYDRQSRDDHQYALSEWRHDLERLKLLKLQRSKLDMIHYFRKEF